MNSIVQDIINPILGMLIGGVDLSHFQVVLKKAVVADPAANIAAAPEVAIKIGAFLNMCIEFFIVAWAVFLLVKGLNKLANMKPQLPKLLLRMETESKPEFDQLAIQICLFTLFR